MGNLEVDEVPYDGKNFGRMLLRFPIVRSNIRGSGTLRGTMVPNGCWRMLLLLLLQEMSCSVLRRE